MKVKSGRKSMKPTLTFFGLALLLVACAHGKTDQFPTSVKSPNTAEVHVIRDNNLWGYGFALKVALDGDIIARLRNGERVAFYVTEGFHSLGISEPSMTVPFEKERTYYFLISPNYSKFGFEIQQIGEKQAEHWLTRTKPIN